MSLRTKVRHNDVRMMSDAKATRHCLLMIIMMIFMMKIFMMIFMMMIKIL